MRWFCAKNRPSSPKKPKTALRRQARFDARDLHGKRVHVEINPMNNDLLEEIRRVREQQSARFYSALRRMVVRPQKAQATHGTPGKTLSKTATAQSLGASSIPRATPCAMTRHSIATSPACRFHVAHPSSAAGSRTVPVRTPWTGGGTPPEPAGEDACAT